MTTTKRKPIGLAWQILIGLILGITVGGVFYGNPHVAEWLKPIGDIFIRMMKMIVVPIVFTTIVLGVSSVGSPKSLGRLGVKTLGYFTIVTMIAIFTGLFAANLVEPGAGINMSTLDKTDISTYVETEETTQDAGLVDKIVNIVRSIPFIILMALLVGVTRVIVGTSIGTEAMIVPIVGATVPFYARQVENALLEIDPGLVEAAKASGLGTLDIIWRVYLREGRVPIIRVSALSFINVVAFSAMAGVVGGGGLGNLAIIRGYNRFQSDVTLVATLIILVIVFVSQLICNLLAKRLQH